MNLNLILVCSNPLPCYVQAAYVLKENRPETEKQYLPVPDKNRFRCFCLNNGETEIYPKEGQPILQDQVQMSVRELIELHYGTSAVIEDRNSEVREEHFEEDIKKLSNINKHYQTGGRL